MEILVIIEQKSKTVSQVAVRAKDGEWVHNGPVHHADLKDFLEDLWIFKNKKEAKLMMTNNHPNLIELKNLTYKIQTVKLS